MTTIQKNTQSNARYCKRKSLVTFAGAACVALWLSACSSSIPGEPTPQDEPQVTHEQSPADSDADDGQPRHDDLEYNLQRLDDQHYTQTYGDGENDKIWYSAAENLGQMGKRAVPHLIETLDSNDSFEVMLALYALQLASQDAQLQAQTEYNYLTLPSVLNPRANNHNKAIALSWWREYQHLWNSTDD